MILNCLESVERTAWVVAADLAIQRRNHLPIADEKPDEQVARYQTHSSPHLAHDEALAGASAVDIISKI